MIQNPYRYNTPPGWNDIRDAPTDGTPIEIQNNWGVAPHYAACRWEEGRGWAVANNDGTSMGDGGTHLSWRPLRGDVAAYVDPTGGAQETREYWLAACGYPPNYQSGAQGYAATDTISLILAGALAVAIVVFIVGALASFML